MFDLTSLRRRAGRDMIGLKSEIDNLFSRFFDIDFPLSRESIKSGEWAPRLDVSEGEEDISISAEVPGCDAKDIEVTLDGRILTINN
jgi:HSP20 family protein